MPLLAVRDLSVVYNPGDWNERQILERVEMRMHPGDFHLLSGPNGSGKSSLLKALSGDLGRARVQGTAELGGTPLFGLPPLEAARRVSVVDQDPTKGTCEHLLVREQLRLVGGEAEVRISARLAAAGSTIELDQRVQSLSGGQRQLLAALIAVERRTPLLLADEPTAALDPQFAALVMDLLLERRGNPAFVTLVVSHHGQMTKDFPGIRRLRLVDRHLIEDTIDDQTVRRRAAAIGA